MVSKSKKENAGKKKKIKVLNLNKETVRNLTDDEAKHVKGGTTLCLIGSIQRVSAVAQSGRCAGETLGCVGGTTKSVPYSG